MHLRNVMIEECSIPILEYTPSSNVTPKGPVIVPNSGLGCGLSISIVVHTSLAVFTHAQIKNKPNQIKGYMHESHYLSVV